MKHYIVSDRLLVVEYTAGDIAEMIHEKTGIPVENIEVYGGAKAEVELIRKDEKE